MENEPQNSEATFSKTEFNSYVKTALEQIKKINEAHKELLEGTAEKDSVVDEINSVLEKLSAGYKDLFVEGPTGISKIGELNTKREEIIAFHKELLLGDGTEKSIKADVEESQEKITEFYVYLFGGTETKGVENSVREAIDKIIKFHGDLTDEEGYEADVKNAHAVITKSYNELYKVDATTGESKMSKLQKDMTAITEFNTKVSTKISPFIEETKADIELKRKDVSALLASAVGGGLIQGFLESKLEYSNKPVFRKVDGTKSNQFWTILRNISVVIANLIAVIADYVMFILPLTLSVLIFIQPDNVSNILGSNGDSDFLSSLSFTNRLLVSLPLWWISLFGYKNIRNKKRLAEEYNHKAQVSRMYLNFSSRETAEKYPITKEARAELDKEMIAVISRHPGQVYGKDDTVFDKLTEMFSAMRGTKPEEVADEVVKAISDAK